MVIVAARRSRPASRSAARRLRRAPAGGQLQAGQVPGKPDTAAVRDGAVERQQAGVGASARDPQSEPERIQADPLTRRDGRNGEPNHTCGRRARSSAALCLAATIAAGAVAAPSTRPKRGDARPQQQRQVSPAAQQSAGVERGPLRRAAGDDRQGRETNVLIQPEGQTWRGCACRFSSGAASSSRSRCSGSRSSTSARHDGRRRAGRASA